MARRARLKKPPRLDLTAYRGQWVAIDPKTQKIIASEMSLRAVEQKALRHGIEHPVLLAVPETDAFFVG